MHEPTNQNVTICYNLRCSREKVIKKLTAVNVTIAIFLSWLTHLSFKDAREMAGLVVMGEDRKNCMLNRREDVQNCPLK